MALFIIISITLFSAWTFVCFLMTKYLIGFVGRNVSPKFRTTPKVIFIISIFVSGVSGYFILFSTPARNYKTAYIEQTQAGYRVTVKGKRVAMVHDPLSAILRRTYEDSISFLLPRQSGTMQIGEIEVHPTKYSKGGSISIDGENMKIDLYYDSAKASPDNWNGSYRLFSR